MVYLVITAILRIHLESFVSPLTNLFKPEKLGRVKTVMCVCLFVKLVMVFGGRGYVNSVIQCRIKFKLCLLMDVIHAGRALQYT